MDEVEVEAFRAGTKASKGLTAAHIAEAAALYDAETAPAPLVFGHPKSDSPALGFISSARAEGNKLFLKIKNIADEVIQGVKDRKILGRSIAFWDPGHPSNPVPGKYTIRHLGLLGGQAPAIAGMPALRFSADEDVLESDEAPADAVIFAVEAEAPTRVQTITESPPKEPTMPKSIEELTAEIEAANERATIAEAKAAELVAAEETRAATFAAAETARRAGEDKSTLDAAVAAGKVLPAERDDLAKLFEALPTEALQFASGEIEPRLALAKFLDNLPKRAPVGDPVRSPSEFTASGLEDARAKEKAALEASRERLTNAHKAPVPA